MRGVTIKIYTSYRPEYSRVRDICIIPRRNTRLINAVGISLRNDPEIMVMDKWVKLGIMLGTQS